MTLANILVNITNISRKNPMRVVLGYVFFLIIVLFFTLGNFRVNTDTTEIINVNLPWRQDKIHYENLFPQFANNFLVVIDSPIPFQSNQAAIDLKELLLTSTKNILSVKVAGAEDFFKRNAWLFLTVEQLELLSDQLIQAQPFLATLASDNSLRGITDIISFLVLAIKNQRISVGDSGKMAGFVNQLFKSYLDKKPLNLNNIITLPSGFNPYRQVVQIKPSLDFNSLIPGEKAAEEIRQIFSSLSNKFPEVTFRLTGSVALADDEFATVADSNGKAGVISFILVLVVLLIALRSWRLIVAVISTLVVGLLATTAFAIIAIGPFNVISIAFLVLFVGIAVDFGIQYSVRFREERYHHHNIIQSLEETARNIGPSLILAAILTSIGFLSFIPTDYKGVAELGLIAGAGMLIAVLLNLSLLPAILMLLKPSREHIRVSLGFSSNIDRFIIRCKWFLVTFFVLLTFGALWLVPNIIFNSNPLALKDPKTESMATLIDLYDDPVYSPFVTEALVDSNKDVQEIVLQLERLPSVKRVISFKNFMPPQQSEKLLIIEELRFFLKNIINPPDQLATPSITDIRQALQKAFDEIQPYIKENVEFNNLAITIERIMDTTDQNLLALQSDMQKLIVTLLGIIRDGLSASLITMENIPQSVKSDWIAPDGSYRLVVYPNGNMKNAQSIHQLVTDIQRITPHLTGLPVNIVESGITILHSFFKAAFIALALAIMVLWVILRNFWHMIYVILPPIIAAVLTVATCVITNIEINLANIIALPLQLGIGVAFTIYYIIEWRKGIKNLVSSSITWAIIFSALTTAVAFGSLAISAHPGTAYIGLLLGLSLFYTLVVTILFLPAFLLTRKHR